MTEDAVNDLLINRYERASDKIIYYCHTIIRLNLLIQYNCINIECWFENFVLINCLFLPLPEHRKKNKIPMNDQHKQALMSCFNPC